MTSQENLCEADYTAKQSKDLNEQDKTTKTEDKEDITGEVFNEDMQNDEIITVSTETSSILQTPTADVGAFQFTSNLGVSLKTDDTDFIEMRKDIKIDNDSEIECVASFRLDFNDVSRISCVSPTKAWISSSSKIRLVDIENGQVLRSFKSDVPVCFLNALNETSFLFSSSNEISKLSIANDNTSKIETFLNFSAGGKKSVQRRLDVFTITQSGDLIVCLNQKWTCACFSSEASLIERYDSEAKLVQSGKIQNNGKKLICDAYSLIVNSNGNICIAGEKAQQKGEYWVVVLDSNFRFRFSYDRNTSSQIHNPSSLATDLKNNLLIVNTFRDRTKRKVTVEMAKKKKELTYVAIIDENGIFRLHLPTDAFHSDGPVRFITIDNESKAWMITDAGQIIVSTFKDLSKTVEPSHDEKFEIEI